MKYPSDLPRTLSRAGVRATAVVVGLMAFGALTAFDIERGVSNYYETSVAIPEFDRHLIGAWSMMQLRLVQTVLVMWLALLGILLMLDGSVRRGSGLALACAGGLGFAVHFVNLPLLGWNGVEAIYGIGLPYMMDAVPGYLGSGGVSPVTLVTPLMHLRLDPLAWDAPTTDLGRIVWAIAACIWAATLATSAAAVYVGLTSLAERRSTSALA